MQALPHRYEVQARGNGDTLRLRSSGVPDLAVAAPAEFDGPGDRWSPETLLAGAVASCLILTFRSVATASRFDWVSLECGCEATLDKADDGRRFTRFDLRATLAVPPGADHERARRLVEKSERLCLVSSSLKGETNLEVTVTTAS